MASTITYKQCPCCGSNNIKPQLVAKDYTVSNQSFDIWHCHNCTVRFTQNVPDEDSIGSFYQSTNYVSHSDTHEGLINNLYHRVRKRTLLQKSELIIDACKTANGVLLDVGSGTGAFAQTMIEAGWKVTGLEPDETARTVAINKYGLQLDDPKILFDLPQNTFDAITMWHVLEHVHNLHGYLDQYQKILKPEGKLIIAVPNYTSSDATAYNEYWAAYDVPRHLYHFSPESMTKLADLKGFKIETYEPMWYDSLYVSMLSEKYKNGKGNLPMAVINGLISNLKASKNYKLCSSVIYVMSKR